jgi:protein-L-isoaspartate(D-aspartate) O-methyltransferase
MNADFSEMRLKMIDGQIRTTDVTNPAILLAMGSVPRELFVDARLQPLAYIDENIEILPASATGPARHLMQPSPFAKLLQLAEIAGGERVLVVGAGTGYSAAVIAALGAEVVAVEQDPVLGDRAEAALAAVGAAVVRLVRGALDGGSPADAPFDVILVEGAVDEIPEHLLEQLAEGGRLVTVAGQGNSGVARVYLKDNGLVTSRRAFNASVKPLPGFERAEAFEF